MKTVHQINILEERQAKNLADFSYLPAASLVPFANAMKSTEEHYEVELTLPPTRQNLFIFVKDNTVCISLGKDLLETENERKAFSLFRTLVLPADVDESKISAFCIRHKLVIIMPKNSIELKGIIFRFFKKIKNQIMNLYKRN